MSVGCVFIDDDNAWSSCRYVVVTDGWCFDKARLCMSYAATLYLKVLTWLVSEDVQRTRTLEADS